MSEALVGAVSATVIARERVNTLEITGGVLERDHIS
jgi:hypothetical protein